MLSRAGTSLEAETVRLNQCLDVAGSIQSSITMACLLEKAEILLASLSFTPVQRDVWSSFIFYHYMQNTYGCNFINYLGGKMASVLLFGSTFALRDANPDAVGILDEGIKRVYCCDISEVGAPQSCRAPKLQFLTAIRSEKWL
ncbi:hypothetical protein EGR_02226 [Echinococcus granulosus]|uniref:Uncharacterized protein n=1 Tax=Echinococcus granulosus TaxID=6210 RepID=W6UML3_ECHGR|nr:hypothetical protein EGR_02226 [Echinococcus granulosus]EUB62785.1 hypothetical protein EGR_02226 [Echinococcus granulosus]